MTMVKRARAHTVTRTNPNNETETVSRYLETEEAPGYKCERDPKASDYEAVKEAWTANRVKWNRQWEKCQEGFSWESSKVRKRRRVWAVDLTARLNAMVARSNERWKPLGERLVKLDALIESYQGLVADLDEASTKADKGETVDKGLVDRIVKACEDKTLRWEKKEGSRKHPLTLMQEVCVDLLYYANKREEW